jgi:hypothetical protein
MAEEGLAYKPRNRLIIRLVEFAVWEDGEIGSLSGTSLLCLLEDNGSEEIDTREFNKSLVPALRYQAMLGICYSLKLTSRKSVRPAKAFRSKPSNLSLMAAN